MLIHVGKIKMRYVIRYDCDYKRYIYINRRSTQYAKTLSKK